MEIPQRFRLVPFVCLVLCYVVTSADDCNVDECSKSVYPIIKDPNSFLPITDEAVQSVCEQFPKTWSNYLVCLKNMTKSCSGLQLQHDEINRAVGDSINTVHKICTNEDFKGGFMAFTHCINEQINEVTFCNEPYQKLLAAMDKGTPKRDICCSSIGLKMCLSDRIEPCCAEKGCSDVIMGSVNFPEVWIDKALGLLTSTCKVDQQDCFPKKIEVTTTSSSGYFPSGPRISEFPASEHDETSKGDGDLRRQTGGAHRHHHDHYPTAAAHPEEQPRSTSGGYPEGDASQKLPKSILDDDRFQPKTFEDEVRTFDDFINNGFAGNYAAPSRSSSGTTTAAASLTLVFALAAVLRQMVG